MAQAEEAALRVLDSVLHAVCRLKNVVQHVAEKPQALKRIGHDLRVAGDRLATLIDDAGLSARIGADQLGHAKVSMTQDRYMRRGKVHAKVAALLDRAINDEQHLVFVPPLGLEPRTCGLKVRSSTN